MSTSCEIALWWMPNNTFEDKWTLVQLMHWCRHTKSNLIQSWPRSESNTNYTYVRDKRKSRLHAVTILKIKTNLDIFWKFHELGWYRCLKAVLMKNMIKFSYIVNIILINELATAWAITYSGIVQYGAVIARSLFSQTCTQDTPF